MRVIPLIKKISKKDVNKFDLITKEQCGGDFSNIEYPLIPRKELLLGCIVILIITVVIFKATGVTLIELIKYMSPSNFLTLPFLPILLILPLLFLYCIITIIRQMSFRTLLNSGRFRVAYGMVGRVWEETDTSEDEDGNTTVTTSYYMMVNGVQFEISSGEYNYLKRGNELMLFFVSNRQMIGYYVLQRIS